jgi:hypothetical protein
VLVLWALWLMFGVQFVHGRLSPPSAASAPAASASIAELGQVGDLFGGINALFAALAGAGVFWAGYLQHRTLVTTRVALADEKTRFDKQQREEHARYNRQQFEATYFQLLALLRDLLQTLNLQHYNADGGPMTVEWVIDFSLDIGPGDLRAYAGSGPTDVAAKWKDVCERADRFVLAKNAAQLSPLFRTVYEIFDHVRQMELTEPELAHKYANITKAQLTDPMLVLFAFYALVDSTKPLTDTIERFHLLEPFARHRYVEPLFKQRYGYSAFDPAIVFPGT